MTTTKSKTTKKTPTKSPKKPVSKKATTKKATTKKAKSPKSTPNRKFSSEPVIARREKVLSTLKKHKAFSSTTGLSCKKLASFTKYSEYDVYCLLYHAPLKGLIVKSKLETETVYHLKSKTAELPKKKKD